MTVEELEHQIELLSQKSLEHSEILIKIQLLLEKIVKDLYGLEEEYVI